MKDLEFYRDPGCAQNQIAICAEDSDTGIAKFYIPVLLPSCEMDEPYDKVEQPKGKLNIKSTNKDIINLSPVTMSNYVNLHTLNGEPVHKGEKFIIVFINEDINRPAIIGRCYE